MANYLSYDRSSQEYKVFLSSLNMTSVPKTVNEALAKKEWSQTMDAEMEALQKNHTWDLVPLPVGKKVVGCKWVYTVKFNEAESLKRYKV
ncbi:unnamed protein product [Spirodela intermedia]|uniref:Uncharacterized protein n=1 Tax=Spirodela intermedia TaxID=51605 RepID=A0A7I8JA45_SPIIN|nr:unnamed protein product [Spirodela intermedia]CAA6666970.1 unnamed protein product [Spirodela intermedia]